MNAAAVIQRKGRELTLRRFSDGTYVDGAYTEDQQPMDQKIVGSVQPMGVREKLLLPEGDRNRAWIKVFTVADVRIDTETSRADRLVVDGQVYEVQQVTDWFLPGAAARLSHREVNAVSVNEKTVTP